MDFIPQAADLREEEPEEGSVVETTVHALLHLLPLGLVGEGGASVVAVVPSEMVPNAVGSRVDLAVERFFVAGFHGQTVDLDRLESSCEPSFFRKRRVAKNTVVWGKFPVFNPAVLSLSGCGSDDRNSVDAIKINRN